MHSRKELKFYSSNLSSFSWKHTLQTDLSNRDLGRLKNGISSLI